MRFAIGRSVRSRQRVPRRQVAAVRPRELPQQAHIGRERAHQRHGRAARIVREESNAIASASAARPSTSAAA